MSFFLGANPLVRIDSSSSRSQQIARPEDKSLLESIIPKSDFITSTSTMLFRLLNKKSQEDFKNRYHKYRLSDMELIEIGLPTNFVTWNVRQNRQNGLNRNPQVFEIVSDFQTLCEIQPFPIVILTESHGRMRLQELLTSEPRTEKLSRDRLFFANTNSFVSVLRVVWSGKGHFQRRGGGAAMAAIFSSLPYLITYLGPDQIGNFVLGFSGTMAPWSRRGVQRGLLEAKSERQTREALEKSIGTLISD